MLEPRSGGRRGVKDATHPAVQIKDLSLAQLGHLVFHLCGSEFRRMHKDMGAVFSFRKSQEFDQAGKRIGGAVASAQLQRYQNN